MSAEFEVPPLVAAALNAAADAHLPALKAMVRAEAADLPGVYRMLGPDGEVVYVGKSKKVRTRLLSYFRGVYPDDKGARILRDSVHIEWEYTPSEFAALLLELRQIKRWRPRFNVLMKRDARHWSFIKLTKGPAPKLHVVRGSTGSADGGYYYGPFQGASGVAEAVRELSDALGLRDCAQATPMRFADQGELFVPELVQLTSRTPRCIRHEIRKCLGPCVAGCTTSQYAERVKLAKGFLEGADGGPLDAMRAQMDALSEAMEFERAAALRDKVWRLESLQGQFERLRFAVETLSFAYVARGHDAEDRVYLVRRGRVRAELPRPHGDEGAAALEALVRDVFVPRERKGAAVPTHEVDELLLLSWWFRHRPAELARTVPAAALLSATGADLVRRLDDTARDAAAA
ncbi:UvrB/UvrC motif-containing protein [Roseisolibacter sp. H3M3-2]|uniref:UvrB/UvrC motif-containing protein n=1 Tax=Roseisolibacter sp. H3M3-2 TaxID=3031323 RepID=UPI0023DBB5C4|nr:UvrB/UvrC motif-containing protein [Roseisolibacter sp. H3M3-2]MDF1501593.1 UvrB/UvrC motif-containing protein [Roseisolibacter sp. H3M3-2]